MYREKQGNVTIVVNPRGEYPIHLMDPMAKQQMEKQRPSQLAHARVPDQGFLRAFLGVLTWRCFVSPRFSPPRYPADARSQDMARIGADMYRSFQLFNEQEK